MATYTLPDLPYDYGALEPHVSGKIMQLHHDKHHRAYVTGANTALDALAEARARDDFSRTAALERSLAFNVSGHVLHSLFWQNLAPRAGGEPTGALADQVKRDLALLRVELLAQAVTGDADRRISGDEVLRAHRDIAELFRRRRRREQHAPDGRRSSRGDRIDTCRVRCGENGYGTSARQGRR